jgi:cobalt-zinc-cadmium efflux system outer membrane protein
MYLKITSAITVMLASAAIAASLAGEVENPAGTITLAEALSLTLEQSPDLAAFSWDIRAAEARTIQARLRPNPELSLSAEDVTGSGRFKSGEQAEHTLQLSQLVELGGKRQARVREAELGRDLADWDYQISRVEVLRATTRAFVDVLVGQRRVALAEKTLALWESTVPLTERRVAAGKDSPAEATRSKVAVASAQIGLQQARRELLAAKALLAAKWGSDTVRFERVSGDLDRMEPVPSLATLTAKLRQNPELARWTAERERRQAALRLARAEAVPNITAWAGPRVVGRADDATIGVLGFSIPLPLFNRNQGNVAEAQALLSKAGPEEGAARSRAFAALNLAHQTLARAADEVDVLKGTVIPGATQTVHLLTEGYTAGRFGQLEVLDARRTLTDARNQHLRALSDFHKALADVEALTAEPVELHQHLEPPVEPVMGTPPSR